MHQMQADKSTRKIFKNSNNYTVQIKVAFFDISQMECSPLFRF